VSSADDLVKGALYAIGAHSEINPADPSLLELGRKKLIAMIREDIAAEIYYGSELDSLTNVALTATGTLEGHDLDATDDIHVSGAEDADFNGYSEVASVNGDTFSYTIAEGEATGETEAAFADLGMRVIHLPEVLGDNVLEDGAASETLSMRLAVRMAPPSRKAVPADVRIAAAVGFAALKARFQRPTVPMMTPSKLLPRGQGSTRGTLPQAFMGGEPLASDTTESTDSASSPYVGDGGTP